MKVLLLSLLLLSCSADPENNGLGIFPHFCAEDPTILCEAGDICTDICGEVLCCDPDSEEPDAEAEGVACKMRTPPITPECNE